MIVESVRIILIFIKKLIFGHISYLVFKIKNGHKATLCEDAINGCSTNNDACYEQCFFCKTSTNTWRGLKFYDKKNRKFYRVNKNVQ